MKKYLHIYSLFAILFCSYGSVFSQITVDASVPLEQLIQNNLIKGCVEISGIDSKFNGSPYGLTSYAYFNRGSSDFPFEDGVMLSTGNAKDGGNPLQPVPLGYGVDVPDWVTDPDLEDVLGITNTLNATSIEFDLISASNQIQFNFNPKISLKRHLKINKNNS